MRILNKQKTMVRKDKGYEKFYIWKLNKKTATQSKRKLMRSWHVGQIILAVGYLMFTKKGRRGVKIYIRKLFR